MEMKYIAARELFTVCFGGSRYRLERSNRMERVSLAGDLWMDWPFIGFNDVKLTKKHGGKSKWAYFKGFNMDGMPS